jgi:hypothetical protein
MIAVIVWSPKWDGNHEATKLPLAKYYILDNNVCCVIIFLKYWVSAFGLDWAAKIALGKCRKRRNCLDGME